MTDLSRYERIAYRYLGRYARPVVEDNPRLVAALRRAHILKRPEVYLASTFLTMAIALAVTGLPVLFLAAMDLAGQVAIDPVVFLYLTVLPPVLVGTIYLINVALPDMRAYGRARDIDAKLPYAINYISTMGATGATPEKIFTTLSRQSNVYGEVANEAAWITRDLQLLGYDVLTALSRAIERSPSQRFQDFLQGAITTLTSGGDLKTYFMQKGEQFMEDNRQAQKRFLEGLGVLAESFVVVVVAAPLFLLVILSTMTTFGANAGQVLSIGYVMVLLLLPLAQAGFAVTIRYTTPEA